MELILSPRRQATSTTLYALTDNDKARIHYLYRRAQSRANYQFEEQTFIQFAEESMGLCQISGVSGSWSANSINSLSFDKIIPGERGGKYEKNNIQVVLRHLNMAKMEYANKAFITWYERFSALDFSTIFPLVYTMYLP